MTIENQLKIIEERLALISPPGPWIRENPETGEEEILVGIMAKGLTEETDTFIAHSVTDIRNLINACRVMAEALEFMPEFIEMFESDPHIDDINQYTNQIYDLAGDLAAAKKCFE